MACVEQLYVILCMCFKLNSYERPRVINLNKKKNLRISLGKILLLTKKKIVFVLSRNLLLWQYKFKVTIVEQLIDYSLLQNDLLLCRFNIGME